MNIKNWATSSQDSEKIATRVKGGAMMLSSLVLFIAMKTGVPMTETDFVMIAQQLSAVVGGFVFLYGWVMRVIMVFAKK